MIRKTEPRDAAAVKALIERLEETSVDEKRFGEIYAANLDDTRIHYLVDEEEGRIVGFISLHIQRLLHHTASIAEIQELIVEAAYRGRGIGGRLFEKAARIARDEGCLQLEVCCNIKRENSHAFYRAMGMNNRHYKFTMRL